jgi:hypothetical protein
VQHADFYDKPEQSQQRHSNVTTTSQQLHSNHSNHSDHNTALATATAPTAPTSPTIIAQTHLFGAQAD